VVGVFLVLFVLSAYGHVTSTAWFASDPEYRPLLRAHRIRMLASLAVIPATMATLGILDRSLSAWLYAGFLAWQAHHYGRQNFGILAFAAAHDGVGPLPKDVGLIVTLTSVAGAIGMICMPSIYPVGLRDLPFALPAVAAVGRGVALSFFLVAAGVMARLLWTQPGLRRGPTVLLFLGLSGAFFLPSLIGGAPLVAFFPYAMAHGAQYLIIMGVTARRSSAGWRGFSVFAAIAAVLGTVAVSVRGVGLVQAYTGVVIWHFLADARLWRLRDSTVRGIVRRRFDFVFGPASAGRPSSIPSAPSNPGWEAPTS